MALGDQRPEEGPRVERVAHRQVGGSVRDSLDDDVVD